ncbi:MAG: carboxypeptidase-like regulatory domain-containing protein [Dysgonomonas sp.]|nr:carboxypeptidase-like regulatory domain-containing protein [Dysgonomonas sp.]
MKLKFIISLFIISFGNLYSQSLEGIVVDSNTGEPISDASIFLNGTSINTKTNAKGTFTLLIDSIINTELIIKHVGYELYIIKNPFRTKFYNISLSQKENLLKEVVVSPFFSREEMLRAFEKQFLGESKAGKSCKILNEYDIELQYKPSSKCLVATAEKPLIINNKYLGYEVTFILKNFEVSFSKDNTLSSRYMQDIFYDGISSFIDLKPNSKVVARRRREVYKESVAYFFRNFVNRTIDSCGFKATINSEKLPSVIKDKNIQNPQRTKGGLRSQVLDHYFTMKDTLSMTMVKVNDKFNSQSFISNNGVTAYMVLSAKYWNDLETQFVFQTDCIFIDRYGNISNPDKVWILGHMSKNRVGNLLPRNYDMDKSP